VSHCQVQTFTSWGEFPLLIIRGGSLVGLSVLVYGRALGSSKGASGGESPLPRRRTRRGKRSPGRREKRASREVDNLAQPLPAEAIEPGPSGEVLKPSILTREARRALRNADFWEKTLSTLRSKVESVKSVRPTPEWEMPNAESDVRRAAYRRYRDWLKGYRKLLRRVAEVESVQPETRHDIVMSRASMDRGKFPLEQFRQEPTETSPGWSISGHAQIAPPPESILPAEPQAYRREFRRGPGGRKPRRYWVCPSCHLSGETSAIPGACPRCATSIPHFVERGPGYIGGVSTLDAATARRIAPAEVCSSCGGTFPPGRSCRNCAFRRRGDKKSSGAAAARPQ